MSIVTGMGGPFSGGSFGRVFNVLLKLNVVVNNEHGLEETA